jgi:hypothetical protein
MLILLLTHVMLVLAVGWHFLRNKGFSMQVLAIWLIIAFFPAGGLLLWWVLVGRRIPDHAPELLENSKDDKKSALVFELIEPLDVSAETNIAPLEETLLVADYGKRREIILNLLKEDISSHVNYINLALYNEDSETAHYAASGILHKKRKLDTSLSIMSSLYHNDTADLTVAYTYADLLQQYLTTVHLDPVNKLYYTYENVRVLEKIISKSRELKIGPLTRLIDLLLEIEDFSRTSVLCQELWDKFPDSEEKFLTLLKSYFIMKDKKNFEQVFRQFRDSDLYFSSETMHVIRLWLGSVATAQTANMQ